MSTGDVDHKLLRRPLYSYAEADYLARVTPGTSKRWLSGYRYRLPSGEQVTQPPVTLRSFTNEAISFLDLVEVTGIGRLKDAGLSLRSIRDIVANCQVLFGTERPLVTLRFRTDGREAFVDRGETLTEVTRRRRGEQAWTEFLAPFLQEIEYEDDLARRWYPLGSAKLIVVDPDYGYGLPVVRGSGIRTELILERFQVGESVREITEDFNLSECEVEQALQWELKLATRAA